jgi:hypothetical protein
MSLLRQDVYIANRYPIRIPKGRVEWGQGSCSVVERTRQRVWAHMDAGERKVRSAMSELPREDRWHSAVLRVEEQRRGAEMSVRALNKREQRAATYAQGWGEFLPQSDARCMLLLGYVHCGGATFRSSSDVCCLRQNDRMQQQTWRAW